MGSSAKPEVRICVPAYNAGATLALTLESILCQTWRELEVLVVDNASTDNTVAVAEAFCARDPRVRLLRFEENIGGEGNFSRCIKLAAGRYTAIFHADDIYSPGMVQQEVEALEKNPAAGAVFTMAEGVDETGLHVRAYSLPPGLAPGPDGLYRFGEVFKAVLKYGNFFFCPSVMARTSVYQDTVKQWNGETYKSSADLDVWLRILQEFPVAILDKPLLKYRLSPSSFSYVAARSRTRPADIFLVLDHYVKNAPPGLLSRDDLRNYELQRLRDNVNRAFNLLLQDKKSESRPLLAALFEADNLLQAVKSIYHLKLLVYGYVVLFLHFLPLTGDLKARVYQLRFGAPTGCPKNL